MPQEGFKRKHATNPSADIVGYSRPMGIDEVGTIQLLTEYREIVVQTIRDQSDRPFVSLNANNSK